MPKLEDGEKWMALEAEWQAVNQEACTARARVTQALAKAAAGDGAGPTSGLMELTEKLEQVADEKRLAMDEFVQRTFG